MTDDMPPEPTAGATTWASARNALATAAGTSFAYPDAGHGSLFQYHDEFVATTLAFPAAPAPHSPTTHIGTP